jgi:outer membrane immunogenic protein
MRLAKSCLLLLLIATALLRLDPAEAQANVPIVYSLEAGGTPNVELGFNYSYLHTNAPPGGCGCFSMEGGFGALILNFNTRFSAVAEITSAHAGDVNRSGNDLTIFNYLVGPRYSLRRGGRRFTPYGQVLAGGAKLLASYPYNRDTNGFGASVGGGATLYLGRHFSWNMGQADWVFTTITNGVNNRQNNFRASSGIVLRFAPR